MPELPKVHKPKWAEAAKRRTNRERVRRNQANRQFKTWDTTWRKMRQWVLTREPLCRECASQGQTTAATQVDHIDGDAFNNETANLQPLCASCHSRKTAREQGRAG